MARPRALATLSLAALALCAPRARAEVVEPNGVRVPGPSAVANETSLQAYFASASENIDALAEANTDPGVFSPLCNFTATLVLSQSSAGAGLAWYNVPADPLAPPVVNPIGPAVATVGQVITSADILSNPTYGGGLVGFALMKNLPNPVPVYFSEYRRNVLCSSCATSDHWKMSLTYQSKTEDNVYYLAFEDWEGANESTWFGNDGDFNDKVFRIQGVTCTGGGEPCETSGLGLCKPGLTACGLGGALVCRPAVTPGPEKCDNVDNDCNGAVDDGTPCAAGYVCQNGACVGDCGSGEFPCRSGTVCRSGSCVDPRCVDVTCAEGKACRGGACVAACDGVVCPRGQACNPASGRCADACAGAECAGGQVCERGVCVAPCTCRRCGPGLECQAAIGECVPEGCGQTSCAPGLACDGAGGCVDPCAGAVCPGNAPCSGGLCGEPARSDGKSGRPIDGGIIVGTGGETGSPGPSGAATGGATAAAEPSTGCGCRTAPVRQAGHSAASALWVLLLVSRRLTMARRGA